MGKTYHINLAIIRISEASPVSLQEDLAIDASVRMAVTRPQAVFHSTNPQVLQQRPNGWSKGARWLGGFKYFFWNKFHPEKLGEMIQVDYSDIFSDGLKPSTTNESWTPLQKSHFSRLIKG